MLFKMLAPQGNAHAAFFVWLDDAVLGGKPDIYAGWHEKLHDFRKKCFSIVAESVIINSRCFG